MTAEQTPYAVPGASPSHHAAGLAGAAAAAAVTPAAPPVIELRGLVKRYGSVDALRGLDLRVERGQVYGFLGRNGAGKTTTLRIIMGITHATGGQAQLFG